MELSTNYMGMALRNPLVASPSPLSYTLDGIRRLADGGAGAIVLFSLFEEQLREEAARAIRIVEATAETFPEALSYFPSVAEEDGGPSAYLNLIERACATVEVPVIASLNGVTLEGWTDYASAMQDAGAAAVELNIYNVAGDPAVSGRDVEEIIDRLETARTRHVLRNHSRIAGNVVRHMTRERAGIDVIAAAGAEPDQQGDGLAGVEIGIRCQRGRGNHDRSREGRIQKPARQSFPDPGINHARHADTSAIASCHSLPRRSRLRQRAGPNSIVGGS